jgi:GntR family transcriptional regulator
VELGISRATLRESIRMLVSDGLLDRRHGIGTFVVRVPVPTIDRGIDELFALHDAIELMGYKPGMGEHAVAVETSKAAADELGLMPDVPLVHLVRVRLADGRPVILCDDFFPRRLLDGQDRLTPEGSAAEIVAGGSLYGWFEERLGLVIDSALTGIEPVSADEQMAAALRVQRGTALLRLRQTHYTAEGEAVLYSENVHNSDVIHFHVQRRRPRVPRDVLEGR